MFIDIFIKKWLNLMTLNNADTHQEGTEARKGTSFHKEIKTIVGS